jgi:hypothetical protein
MGYKSMIRGQVNKAFSLVKDLADIVTLTEKNATGFNFSTNTATISTPTTKSIKGLLVERKNTKGKKDIGTTLNMSYLFKSDDLNSPDIYDTITTSNGDVWKMVPPYINDGYLITVNVTKES